ncbi:MAG: RidA family protein [Hyphomicrobiaceae bacterium]
MAHRRYRKFNMKDRYRGYVGQDIDFDLCMAVRAGNRIFLRGQSATSLDGVYAGDDPAAQAETAMANVKALLEEAGGKLEHICKTTIYITDYAHREPVYRVIGKWMKGIHPCSTGLIVAGLAKPNLKMEIDVEAIVPDEA